MVAGVEARFGEVERRERDRLRSRASLDEQEAQYPLSGYVRRANIR
jgi:hypothetical protein